MEKDNKMSEHEECQNLISIAGLHSERFWQSRKLQINFTLLFWGGLLAGVAFSYPYKTALSVPMSVVIWTGIVIFAVHAGVLFHFSTGAITDKKTFRESSLRASRLLKMNRLSENEIMQLSKAEITIYGDLALIIALATVSIFIYTVGVLLMISGVIQP